MRILEGKLDASGMRFAVVASRFNEAITDRLVQAALDCLRRHGADPETQTLVRVPGAFEVALAARVAADGGEYDGVIALGALIRGGTSHFDVLASEVTGALGRVAASSGVPIAFGVLTCDTVEQAVERSGGKGANKGFEAALSAIEMVSLLRAMKQGRSTSTSPRA